MNDEGMPPKIHLLLLIMLSLIVIMLITGLARGGEKDASAVPETQPICVCVEGKPREEILRLRDEIRLLKAAAIVNRKIETKRAR